MPFSTNFLLLLAAVFAACLFLRFRRRRFPVTFRAKVVWVCDGDSIYVRRVFRPRIKLRLAGIDAPESEQRHGDKATNYLRRMIDGKIVKVTLIGRDPYGRYVARVLIGSRDVSLDLLDAGLCWPYYRYFHTLPWELRKRYREAGARAKGDRRGLWKDRAPEPPWTYRERHRSLISRILRAFRKVLCRLVKGRG